MTQDEILIRIREAHIKAHNFASQINAAIRRMGLNNMYPIETLAQALTDAHRPLSEIVPPDPDLIAAREWAAKAHPALALTYLAGSLDDGQFIQGFLASCRYARGEGA